MKYFILFVISIFLNSTILADSSVKTDKTDKVILSVFNKKNELVLKIKESDLLHYNKKSFFVTTPWYDSKKKFSGILFKELLLKSGISKDSQLNLIALDDFNAQVPAKDAFDYNTILATHIDNERITLRDKGPFFLIYPMDDFPNLKTGIYYNRSVWQIKEIHELN